MDDVRAYLARQLDALVAQVSGGERDLMGAQGWIEGAVRALEATGSLDRAEGGGVVDELMRRLVDEGIVQRLSVSRELSGHATAVGRPTTAAHSAAPSPPPPTLEGVVPVGRTVDLPGPLTLVVLYLARWSDGAELGVAVTGPMEELRASQRASLEHHRAAIEEASRSRLLGTPWHLDAWDDVGTRYRVGGGSSSGGKSRVRAIAGLSPRVPDQARTLTLTFTDEQDSTATLDVTLRQIS